MGLYSDVIFPRFYDCFADRPFFAKYRQRQLAAVGGEILEIGVGTGLNLPHYPPHVRKITTVDPNPGMNKVLQRRIRQTDMEVDGRIASSEQLPFDANCFDSVVSTLTLCSIAQVERALAELYRVLTPGGRFVFFEHGVSPDADVLKWQRRLNWLQRRLGGGCRLDLDVRGVLASQPFRSVEIDDFYLEKVPKTHGYIYRGTAVK